MKRALVVLMLLIANAFVSATKDKVPTETRPAVTVAQVSALPRTSSCRLESGFAL